MYKIQKSLAFFLIVSGLYISSATAQLADEYDLFDTDEISFAIQEEWANSTQAKKFGAKFLNVLIANLDTWSAAGQLVEEEAFTQDRFGQSLLEFLNSSKSLDFPTPASAMIEQACPRPSLALL